MTAKWGQTLSAPAKVEKQKLDEIETLVQSIDTTIQAKLRVDQYLLQVVPERGTETTVYPIDFSVSSRGIVRVDCRRDCSKGCTD